MAHSIDAIIERGEIMAHNHKNRNSMRPEQAQNPYQNQPPNPLGNFDLSSILGMLNNLDMNQVSSMLSQLGIKPGNLNNSNQSNNTNNKQEQEENYDSSSGSNSLSSSAPQLSDILNNIDMNQVQSMLSNMGINPNLGEGKSTSSHKGNDNRIEVLNSLKPFLPEDKCKMIDEIINFLSLKGAIDKAVPPKKKRR